MKYFAYCRKSSEGEERQALSILAQIDEIKRVFGASADMELIEWFEEKMSAKAPGRPVWGTMIKRLEKGEADGIVAWHPDRLARNSVDGGWIIHLLDRRVLKDLKFVSYSYEHSPQGMFMLQIMFGQSKYYVDNLSVNVKRGLRKRVSLGWHPGLAPLGYRNDRDAGIVVPDPERFDLCRRLWSLLLAGARTPAELHRLAYQWGLRMPRRPHSGGGPVTRATMYRLFANPFYAGIIVTGGEWHKGKHEAMITLDEFSRAQTLIGRPGYATPRTHEFAFTGGVIRCACGLFVTAEEKIKPSGRRYVYYHCTRKQRPRCHEPATRSDVMEEAIVEFLSGLRLPRSLEAWLAAKAARDEHDGVSAREAHVQAARRALKGAEDEMRVLLDLRTREVIEEGEYLSKRQNLKAEMFRLQETLREGPNDDEVRLELLDCVSAFRKHAVDWFRASSLTEKRLIVQTAGSNCVLKDGKLNIQARIPFQEVTSDPQFLIWRGRLDGIGTLPEDAEEVKRIIQSIKYLKACAEARQLGGIPPENPYPRKRKHPPRAHVGEVRLKALRAADDQEQAAA